MPGEHRSAKISLNKASYNDSYGLEKMNFNSLQRIHENDVRESAAVNALPRYYEAFGRNCPKKLLSKKKKTIQLELFPTSVDSEDGVLERFSRASQKTAPLSSFHISVSDTCSTSKNNRIPLDSTGSSLWCNTKNGLRESLSVACTYSDEFLFDDFDSEAQHYAVGKKDNWTVPPALIKSQQQNTMFTDFYNFTQD
uniref:Protein aurora borealis n=1 Tax=Syphacia muris TaxID=451379 RepID=A0A0N5AFQ8_9BILA